MTYWGDDPNTYKNATYVSRGGIQHYYEQSEGNGDFSDLVNFIKVVNLTPNDTFEQSVSFKG